MTRNVLLSLLRQGSTGDEILQILDNITSDDSDNGAEPTLEEIQF